jgi:UDP-N-acetylmuramate dehydrogenase
LLLSTVHEAKRSATVLELRPLHSQASGIFMTLSQNRPVQRNEVVSISGGNMAINPRPSGISLMPLGASLEPVSLPDSNCVIKPQISLSTLTSYRVGGPAEWYVAPRSLDDFHASVQWAKAEGLPVTVIGAGSNLLISDQGLPGLVICTRHLRGVQFDEATGQVRVEAGFPIARLAWQAADKGWRGLEWSVGIPGTVGGCVVMNAGAHRYCMDDILITTTVLEPDLRVTTLQKADLAYAYRSSVLQGSDRLILDTVLQLHPGDDPQAVLARTTDHLEQRRNTQPYHLPSCGSVFRNPPDHSAGWLIENTGLKGYQIGQAQVAQRHANFILNCGGATATDIFQLIRHVQKEVETKWQVRLHPEVKMLGEFPPVS